MKFIIFTINLLWVVATAQTIADLPSCASNCATTALGSTSCGQTDIKCICSDNGFIESVGTCTIKACSSPADVSKALSVATNLCKSAGVTIPASEISSLTAMSSATSGASTPTSSGASATSTSSSSGSSSSATGSNGTSVSSAAPSQATGTGAASQSFGLSGAAVGAALAAFFM